MRTCLLARHLVCRKSWSLSVFAWVPHTCRSRANIISKLPIHQWGHLSPWLSNINNRFWKRYVDDTCGALPPKTCKTFLDLLNLMDPSTQFTSEQESDGKLPFLEILLEHHLDRCISTSVHRKTTHTNKYLDFDSHHPFAYKLAVVCTLQHRANVLSSTREACSGCNMYWKCSSSNTV